MLRNKRFHKHLKLGSLQLSIEAIVVLIIAITVLGLGLSFVKTLFGGTFEKLSGISEQLGEEDKRALMNSPAEITMLTTELHVSGKDVGLNVGVRNNRKSKLIFILKDGLKCFDYIGATDQAAKDQLPQLIKFDTFVDKEIGPSQSAIIPNRPFFRSKTH